MIVRTAWLVIELAFALAASAAITMTVAMTATITTGPFVTTTATTWATAIALRAFATIIITRPTSRWASEGVIRNGQCGFSKAFDVAQVAALRPITEREGNALGPGARGAANAVDIAFGDVRQFVVDDVADVRHVNATGRNVGRHEHAHMTFFEVIERFLAGVLRFVTVNGIG